MGQAAETDRSEPPWQVFLVQADDGWFAAHNPLTPRGLLELLFVRNSFCVY